MATTTASLPPQRLKALVQLILSFPGYLVCFDERLIHSEIFTKLRLHYWHRQNRVEHHSGAQLG